MNEQGLAAVQGHVVSLRLGTVLPRKPTDEAHDLPRIANPSDKSMNLSTSTTRAAASADQRDASQSRSAWFKRVCQPAPVRLKADRTSASSRMFTWAFGAAAAGRPRRGFSNSAAAAVPTRPGKTSDAGFARANQAASASGASSSSRSGRGLGCVISGSFAPAGAAQADHMNCSWYRGEDQHVQVPLDHSQDLEPALGVGLALILHDQCTGPFKLRRQFKTQLTLQDVAIVLSGIVAQVHILYPQKIANHVAQRTAMLCLVGREYKSAYKNVHSSLRPTSRGLVVLIEAVARADSVAITDSTSLRKRGRRRLSGWRHFHSIKRPRPCAWDVYKQARPT